MLRPLMAAKAIGNMVGPYEGEMDMYTILRRRLTKSMANSTFLPKSEPSVGFPFSAITATPSTACWLVEFSVIAVRQLLTDEI